MSRTRSTAIVVASTASAVAGLSACGVSTDGAMQQLGASTSPRVAQTSPVTVADRPAGQVAVSGVAPSSLTQRAAEEYRRAGGSTAVTPRRMTDAEAYAALCDGHTDLVDSARPMTRAEQARCGAAGRSTVQFTVAADAAVLVTQGESDIGADCLTLPQVRQMFRAGSPVYDWSQLGFDDVALRVAGPQPSERAFGLLGRLALDAGEPSLTDVRSDYSARTPAQVVEFVTGDPSDARLASQRPLAAAKARAAATRAADAATSEREATAELVAARKDRRKGIADRRPAADQRRASARLATARRAAARASAYRASAVRELTSARAAATAAGGAARRQAALRGRLAVLSYRDYAIVASRVRALEISQRDGAAASCTFPSAVTATSGSYPLSQPLLITTTSDELSRTEVKSFLASYLNRARDLARENGLVPIPAATVATQLSWLRHPDATARAAQSASNR